MKHKYPTSNKHIEKSKQMNIKKLLGIILAFVVLATIVRLLSKCSSPSETLYSKQMTGWQEIPISILPNAEKKGNTISQGISKLNANSDIKEGW